MLNRVKPVPQSPDDFYWESGKGDLNQALQFLIDLRRYVGNLEVPEGKQYRQIPHSGDPKPVGGDVRKPAVLDASYEHFGNDYLSISWPNFTPGQKEWIIFFPKKVPLREMFVNGLKNFFSASVAKPQEQDFRINTGLHGPNLQEAVQTVLKAYGINYSSDTAKLGYCLPEGTNYYEVTVDDAAEYEKGRRLIQAFVHGNAETPQQLKAEIDQALGVRSPAPVNAAKLEGI